MGSAMSFRAVLSVEEEAEIMNGTETRPPAPASGKGDSNWTSARANFGHFGRSHTAKLLSALRQALRDQEEDRV